MKNFTLVTVLCSIVFINLTLISCTKEVAQSNKPIENIDGNWSINRVQVKLFYSGAFVKDSILTNGGAFFTSFNKTTNAFTYKYRLPATETGTYITKGVDSIIATTNITTHRWKMITLTDVLFTAMKTSTTDPAFPGATVETYYTFVR